jgi:hypothetical protein
MAAPEASDETDETSGPGDQRRAGNAGFARLAGFFCRTVQRGGRPKHLPVVPFQLFYLLPMRFLPLALGGLFLTTALPALAQSSADAPAPSRFYVGLGAYSSYYQQVGNSSLGLDNRFRLPVQVTAGYQLSPRLAAQIGVAYSTDQSRYGQTVVYSTSTPGTPSPYMSTEGRVAQWQTSVSALARYTLTANPAHRLQFDALGGFTLEHRRTSNQGSLTNSSQGTATTSSYDFNSKQNTFLLTGGVGARYRLSRHFELTYDFTVNKALNNSSNVFGNAITGTNALTSSSALGLRYRFGK